MGKLILVFGENNSGKSRYAEELIGNMKLKKYYIATMIPQTDENYRRIEKHRLQREKYGFETLEKPYNVYSTEITENSIVLLEDVSNLLANNIFEKKKNADDVLNDIILLLKHCKTVVAVTISGIEDNNYNEETAFYIKSLNELNKRLFDISKAAIEMKNNTAVYLKGDENDII